MKKQTWVIVLLVLVTACACGFFLLRYSWGIIMGTSGQMDPLDNPPLSGGEYYEIEPDKILADIANGKKDIFRFYEEREIIPDHPSGSFAWTSADYFVIANSHRIYRTREFAKGGWKLFAPGSFEIDRCRNDMQGFDRATIIFYKREAKSFPVLYMEIRPLTEAIYSVNIEYARIPEVTFFDKFLNNPDASFQEALSVQGAITADEALQIAEEAGGAELRQRLSNNCRIRISYFTDDWVVMYYQGMDFLLKVDIDAKDGTYKIDYK